MTTDADRTPSAASTPYDGGHDGADQADPAGDVEASGPLHAAGGQEDRGDHRAGHSPEVASAAKTEQLELIPVPRCDFCGPTGWTIERFGRETHKCRCPYRTDDFCQAHPNGDCELPEPRWNPKWPLKSLYGETWEDIFVCAIDESGGLRDTA